MSAKHIHCIQTDIPDFCHIFSIDNSEKKSFLTYSVTVVEALLGDQIVLLSMFKL